MDSEIKICQNCKQNFTIESEDFDFYRKIDVPPPTFCPECRMMRRFLWKNERSLYKRKCNVLGHNEEFISMYSPESDVVLYDKDFWWSDKWNPLEYGIDYDLNRSFFEQFHELQKKTPRCPLVNNQSINSDYCNFADENKNCYLITTANRNENSFYGFFLVDNKDIMDCLFCSESELIYDCVDCHKCFRLFSSQQCKNCIDSSFLFDCSNCNNCLFSVGLRGKSYYLFNKPCSREEYEEERKKIFGSHRKYSEAIKKFEDIKLNFSLRKCSNLISCNNASGDFIFQSKNVKEGFDVYDSENISYAQQGVNSKDSFDIFSFDTTELCYESLSVGLPTNKCLFTVFCRSSDNLTYCDNCRGSHDLFGCVSLRNKSYCILNKQYTKEQYEEMVPKIIRHMNEYPYKDTAGNIYRYGDFFPTELCPFAYNETLAQEYFPLKKGVAIQHGFSWKTNDTKQYPITVEYEKIPDRINDVPDSIIKEVFGCAHAGVCVHQCTTAFRIVPEELSFYKKMDIPLPRLCSNCRHYERLKKRNPMRLWYRSCQCAGEKSENGVYTNTASHKHGRGRCPTKFKTSYAPERSEIVYCESCYQSEIA
jgi:hypothetical protein